jgi:hypothetical protein
MYLSDSCGYVDGFDGSVWEIDEVSIEWNRENWDLIKNHVDYLKLKGLPFRYFDMENYFWLESSYYKYVKKFQFVNLYLDDFEMDNLINRINDIYDGGIFKYSKGIERIDSGQFSNVYIIDGKWIWKEYKDFNYSLYGKSLNKDGEILNDLYGLGNFPKVYAYIPNKGYIADYVKGKEFDFDNYHEEDFEELVTNIIDLIDIAEDRGYLARDIKEDNIIDRGYMSFVMLDVGYFKKLEDVEELVDELEIFTFESGTPLFWNILRESWILRGKDKYTIDKILENIRRYYT